MLQRWLIFCSIYIGPWHRAQSELSPLCSQWLIQSTSQLLSYDAALGTHGGPSLIRKGRREKEGLHSYMDMHACFESPGLHAQHQAALEGRGWEPHVVIHGFMISFQKHWLSGSCTSTSSSPNTSAQTVQAEAMSVAHSTVPLLFVVELCSLVFCIVWLLVYFHMQSMW